MGAEATIHLRLTLRLTVGAMVLLQLPLDSLLHATMHPTLVSLSVFNRLLRTTAVPRIALAPAIPMLTATLSTPRVLLADTTAHQVDVAMAARAPTMVLTLLLLELAPALAPTLP
jgi:uncharacterized membrane protein